MRHAPDPVSAAPGPEAPGADAPKADAPAPEPADRVAIDALWREVAAEPWRFDFYALLRRIEDCRPYAAWQKLGFLWASVLHRTSPF